MPHFTKPAAGSWTENYPELGTAIVDFTDSTDPQFYKDEQEAIFKKSWLNVGRVEQVRKVGSYFTREIAVINASLIIVKDQDQQVRAFYNICRHRGNKLVWDDYPGEETSGTCRQFTCKYHAWRYNLDGQVNFVQQEQEFFDLDKSLFGLKPVRCEVWQGFIFINVDDAAQPLEEYLGAWAKGLEGYPFHEMTEVYSYRAEVGANWKLFIDAFAEFYHAPILHMKQAVKDEADKLANVGFEALHYECWTPHSMVSSWGGMAPPRDINMVKPIERELRSGLFGPWDRPDIEGLDPLPSGVNPAKHKAWGVDEYEVFPNFGILIWAPGWYLTYHYWPTAVNKHIFEARLYFVPPRNARERLRQELAGVTFKEYALQDANTLEATQTMLETGTITEFPLNDQEVLLRHLHVTVQKIVKEYRDAQATETKSLPAEFADWTRFSDWILATEPERYAKRLASSMPEMQDVYDTLFPRLQEALDYVEKYDWEDLPDEPRHLFHLLQSLVMVSFPVEVWKQPRVPDSGAAYLHCISEPVV